MLIVVANDGSEGGFKALALGCDLAKRCGAALHMISVEELPDFPASRPKPTSCSTTRPPRLTLTGSGVS
jgi:hypothetical protein